MYAFRVDVAVWLVRKHFHLRIIRSIVGFDISVIGCTESGHIDYFGCRQWRKCTETETSFDIFVIVCTESGYFSYLRCRQKCCQNENISVSLWLDKIYKREEVVEQEHVIWESISPAIFNPCVSAVLLSHITQFSILLCGMLCPIPNPPPALWGNKGRV